jgi:hypothetical protein
VNQWRRVAKWAGVAAAIVVGAHRARALEHSLRIHTDMPVVTYTVLDDDFPAAVAELVVKYICRWHRDPRFVLAGRAEFHALRGYPAYVLSVENGERWYFQSVIILPVALDNFLDVVG